MVDVVTQATRSQAQQQIKQLQSQTREVQQAIARQSPGLKFTAQQVRTISRIQRGKLQDERSSIVKRNIAQLRSAQSEIGKAQKEATRIAALPTEAEVLQKFRDKVSVAKKLGRNRGVQLSDIADKQTRKIAQQVREGLGSDEILFLFKKGLATSGEKQQFESLSFREKESLLFDIKKLQEPKVPFTTTRIGPQLIKGTKAPVLLSTSALTKITALAFPINPFSLFKKKTTTTVTKTTTPFSTTKRTDITPLTPIPTGFPTGGGGSGGGGSTFSAPTTTIITTPGTTPTPTPTPVPTPITETPPQQQEIERQAQQTRGVLEKQQRQRQSPRFRQLTPRGRQILLEQQRKELLNLRLIQLKRLKRFKIVLEEPVLKLGPKIKKKRKSRRKLKFDVITIKKGKVKVINKKPFKTKTRAKNFGFRKVDDTLLASFKVIKSIRRGKNKKIPRTVSKEVKSKFRIGKTSKRKGFFIEKVKFRFDRPKEKVGLRKLINKRKKK